MPVWIKELNKFVTTEEAIEHFKQKRKQTDNSDSIIQLLREISGKLDEIKQLLEKSTV